MYKILLRFKIAKNNRVIEVYFDSRLSFKENFELFNNICEEKMNPIVFDDNKKLFLDTQIPIGDFNINSFKTFILY